MGVGSFLKAAVRGEAPGQGGPKKQPAKPAENPFLTPKQPTKGSIVSMPGSEKGTANRAPTWTHEPEPASRKIWATTLRVVAFAVLLLLVWLGIRSLIFPPATPPAPELPLSVQFPSTMGEGVAERFAVSYLSWDEEKPKDRSAQMALDLVGGSDTNALGWDGRGKQIAANPYVAAVNAQSASKAQITVYIQVTGYTKAGTEWKSQGTDWQALEVPVAISDGRAVVTGQPGMVGVSSPKALETNTGKLEDPTVTAETRSYVTSFFTAYGQETDVSALTSPGSVITGLNGALTFGTLKAWTAYEGDSQTRSATATVVWKTKSGGTLETSYSLELAKVAGNGADRWQVRTIIGGSQANESY